MLTKRIVVLGAIIEKEGKILLARRAQGRNSAGKWEFPGGKLEKGETEQECLMRELKEEMNVEAEVGDHFMDGGSKEEKANIHLRTYKTKLLSYDFNLTAHDIVVWVKPEEIMSYDLATADITIARKLADRV